MFCWKSNLQFFYTDVSLNYPSVMLGNVFSAQMIRFQSRLLYFNTLTTGNLLVIFRYFLKMLFIFSSSPFYTNCVHLPRVNDPPSPYIKDNLKFHPFFEDAIGAMDGSHFLSSGTAEEQALAWDRKGLVTQLSCRMWFQSQIYLYLFWLGGICFRLHNFFWFLYHRFNHPTWQILPCWCRISYYFSTPHSILRCSVSSCWMGPCRPSVRSIS